MDKTKTKAKPSRYSGYVVAWRVNRLNGGVMRGLCDAKLDKHGDDYVQDIIATGAAWFASPSEARAFIVELEQDRWYSPHGTYGAPTYYVINLAKPPIWVQNCT